MIEAAGTSGTLVNYQTAQRYNPENSHLSRQKFFSELLVIMFYFLRRLPRPTSYQKAEEEYKRKQEEKIAKLKEAQKKREERTQAIARYQTSKAEVFKKLSKKTKKGQPVMKGRIEILLHKLQRDLQS
jgi:hypothetical protein